MSENTPGESQEITPTQPDEGLVNTDEGSSQTAQPTAGEVDTSAPGDEADAQGEQPIAAEAPQESASTLPPEAQGEANGGPLGCCLGMMVGLLLSLSLAIFSRAYATELGNALQGNFWLLGLLVRILMGILAFALAIFFGSVGWKMGKRFYRVYEPPPDRRSKRRSDSKKLQQKV